MYIAINISCTSLDQCFYKKLNFLIIPLGIKTHDDIGLYIQETKDTIMTSNGLTIYLIKIQTTHKWFNSLAILFFPMWMIPIKFFLFFFFIFMCDVLS
jgi:hypothetical protein